MKSPALTLIAALAVLPLAACSPSGTASATPQQQDAAKPAKGSVRTINVDTFQAELPKAPIVVDVRTAGEFSGGHVPGAINIPVSELGSRLAELDSHRSAPVYLICQSGGRSARGAKQLAAAGFDVVDVAGGTGAWKAKGYPVE